MRFAVGGVPRLVEQYVSQPDLDDDPGAADEIAPNDNAWLSYVVDGPGAPRLIRPVPARAVRALTAFE